MRRMVDTERWHVRRRHHHQQGLWEDGHRRPLLVVTGVAVRALFLGRDGEPRQLRDVAISARPGELVAVIGASGAGKSTLLSVLAGLLTPTNAVGTVADAPLGSVAGRRIGGIGYVP